MTNELDELRGHLDEVDRRLVDALADRERLVASIAQLKAGGDSRIRDLPREEELLGKLVEHGKLAGLDGFFVARLFREILEHSVRLQQEHLVDRDNPSRAVRALVVAYQGGEGSYSHMACRRHFGARKVDAAYQGFPSFESMLESVSKGEADYGVLPIENTTAGSINESYDLLTRMHLHLVGEEIQRVEHCLIALEPVPLSNIRRVFSHPQALLQCSNFLGSLQDCHAEAFLDTALAAEKIKLDKDLSQAAIASEEAARTRGLVVIKRDIANHKENFTRMVIVAREPERFDLRIPCKTSLVFATRHEEGALVNGLRALADQGLSLTKLESRPRPNTPWQYLFYVDFEGNIADANVQRALQDLASRTEFLKVLGSYPARTIKDMQPAEPRTRSSGGSADAAAKAAATPIPPAPAGTALDPAVIQNLEKKPYKLASRSTRVEDTVIHVGKVAVGGPKQIIVAGPCAVESRDQIRACARIVKELGGDLLRGGCFKPRTSPYSFQGLGYEALDMLEEAGREVGLPIVTEVLDPADVAKVALQADVLQIGARNMQNFALLKEVGRVDRPVLLKRGMTATIDEWLQAAEYVLAHGNQQVILCERGIRTFETATRNTLDLSAVPAIRELSHLPVVVDPSHAVGVRRWIPSMAEASLASGAHGVMIEIHPDPSKALSDGPQALPFPMFEALMHRLRP